jgi:hypothetical protein
MEQDLLFSFDLYQYLGLSLHLKIIHFSHPEVKVLLCRVLHVNFRVCGGGMLCTSLMCAEHSIAYSFLILFWIKKNAVASHLIGIYWEDGERILLPNKAGLHPS